jgi:ribonuclease P protein component
LDDTSGPTPRPWGRLKRRPEFQRAGKGRRVGATAFTLQANVRPGEAEGPRFGLTVTKKTGNSPVRNRIRRRLREAMRRISPLDARPDHDYVLAARREALSIPFDALVADIAGAIRRANADKRGGPARDGRP